MIAVKLPYEKTVLECNRHEATIIQSLLAVGSEPHNRLFTRPEDKALCDEMWRMMRHPEQGEPDRRQYIRRAGPPTRRRHMLETGFDRFAMKGRRSGDDRRAASTVTGRASGTGPGHIKNVEKEQS